MKKILEISTYGLKNLSNKVTLSFCNSTVDKTIKATNIKGIFGYNGSGKTAIISSVALYKDVCLNSNYLFQNETINKLNKLINFEKKEFYFEIIFSLDKEIIKHSMLITKDKISGEYIINKEIISKLVDRTTSGEYKILLERSFEKEELKGEFVKNNFFDNIELLNYKKSLIELILSLIIKKPNLEEELKVNKEWIDTFLNLYFSISNIIVYLLNDDNQNSNFDRREEKEKILINLANLIKNDTERSSLIFQLSSENTVLKKDFQDYALTIGHLADFIKVFKPDLINIELDKTEDKDFYYIKKIFNYGKYKVDYSCESAGIKQLTQIFTALYLTAQGKFGFIDEIDTNINEVYFEKLVEYFSQLSSSQLCFTSHNIEIMNVLKEKGRLSIDILGKDNSIDHFLKHGNSNPSKLYRDGYFVYSPMNVESFDFAKVFSKEE